MSEWTRRDLEIAETLARRVRVLSLRQIASIWWKSTNSDRDIRRRLRRLGAAGLVTAATANALPVRPARRLFGWMPGGIPPNSHGIISQLRTMPLLPSAPTQVFVATRLAASMFGSVARRIPRFDQIDRELQLAECYVAFRRNRSVEAKYWLKGDAFEAATRDLGPGTAFIATDDRRIECAVKSVAGYSEDGLERFHRTCLHSSLPYELW